MGEVPNVTDSDGGLAKSINLPLENLGGCSCVSGWPWGGFHHLNTQSPKSEWVGECQLSTMEWEDPGGAMLGRLIRRLFS